MFYYCRQIKLKIDEIGFFSVIIILKSVVLSSSDGSWNNMRGWATN